MFLSAALNPGDELKVAVTYREPARARAFVENPYLIAHERG